MRRAICAFLLALGVGCASRAPAPPKVDAPEVATPAPAPAAVATPVPTGPPPVAIAPLAEVETIRVLLDRGEAPVALPQPGRAYRVEAGGDGAWLWGPLEITVVSEPAWQVGAWSSAEAAVSVAARLERELGGAARVWSEAAGGDLVRVRVRWPDGEPTDAAARLASAGFDDAFRVSGAGELRVRSSGGSFASTSEVLLSPADAWPTVVGARSYRGRFRAREVGGELLVINELGLESYLRGVVPVEMGPYQFPELEALKAQAVAARTYAVAHLGDHDDEGWDICDTPACQAYSGAGSEHELSDRAIEETAGLIAVFGGLPIDAMYTSTCGGRTEDAGELFPDRAQPYLRGVACAWERPLRLEGSGESGRYVEPNDFDAEIARQVLGVGETASPAGIVRAVHEMSGVTATLPAPADPESYVTALLAAAGLEVPPAMVRASSGLGTLLVLSDLFELGLSPPTEGLSGPWPAAAALAVLELRGDVIRDRGEAVPHRGGVAIYPTRASASQPLPTPLPLWERWAGASRRVPEADVLPGTQLERWRVGDRIVALVIERSGGADEADRRSAWRSWIRDRSWDELARRLEIPDLERLSVTRRGSSGRVLEMVARGRSGRERRLEGFPIRRSLDLPENLFSMHLLRAPDGSRTVRFLGRGWGHGVGLCQNGAYGLARAGMSFDAILRHYYTGVEIRPRKTD